MKLGPEYTIISNVEIINCYAAMPRIRTLYLQCVNYPRTKKIGFYPNKTSPTEGMAVAVFKIKAR